MNLNEWKEKKLLEHIDLVKAQIREGAEVSSSMFNEEEINLFAEEVEVEDFCEEVNWGHEIDLTEELLENCEELQEYLEFIPSPTGDKMDLEFEVDLDEFNPSIAALNAIKEMLFAEDYTWTLNEDKNRAQIVFKRAGGTINKKKKCGPGMRLKGKRCIPQTGGQKAKERIKGIKLKRAKRAMGKGAKKRATIKSKITKRRVKGRARNFAGIN